MALGSLPVVMGLAAIVFFGERPTARFLLSLALATTGVLLLALPTGSDGNAAGGSLLGLALVFGAVLSEAAFLLLNKGMRCPLPPAWQAAAMATFGLVLSLPLTLVPNSSGRSPTDLPATALWSVTYYALIPTVLGFLLWYAGSARASARSAALATATMPVAAIALSSIVLGEVLTLPSITACVLVTAAIIAGAGKDQTDQ